MLDRYLDSVLPASNAVLVRLEQQAYAEGIPIVGRRAAALIQLLVRIAQPDLIVELGTATGYSGIWLLRGSVTARLITFEVDETRAAQARDNFAEAGLTGRADVRVGNAVEGLEEIPASAGGGFNTMVKRPPASKKGGQGFPPPGPPPRPGGGVPCGNPACRGGVSPPADAAGG